MNRPSAQRSRFVLPVGKQRDDITCSSFVSIYSRSRMSQDVHKLGSECVIHGVPLAWGRRAPWIIILQAPPMWLNETWIWGILEPGGRAPSQQNITPYDGCDAALNVEAERCVNKVTAQRPVFLWTHSSENLVSNE